MSSTLPILLDLEHTIAKYLEFIDVFETHNGMFLRLRNVSPFPIYFDKAKVRGQV
jgi:hypothetical protein